MSFQDEWGRDPSVRMMRRVFAQMEVFQKDLLERLKISPFDDRLRLGREGARDLFERVWPMAAKRNITRSEEDAAILYVYCLAKFLKRKEIEILPEALPDNERISKFVDEEVE